MAPAPSGRSSRTQRPRRASQPRQKKSKVEIYKATLVPLMNYIHSTVFLRDHDFTQDELVAVTPEKIITYLKIKVYGNENAHPDVDPPLHYRLNTVKVWKKSWSYHMVNKNMPWNEIAKVGNPTRSHLINDLLKNMKKMETARLGVPSQARRALVAGEYEQFIRMMCENDDKQVGSWLAAYNCFQYNMIARVDDSAKWRSPDLQPLEDFENYGVTVRLPWAKNVMDPRDAPTQVLFGAMDWRYCAISLLAVWLEYHYMINPEENAFFLALNGLDCPLRIKEAASYHLRTIFNDEEFNLMAEGLTGTHSERKFAVNNARKNGCSKDDTDHRGRWKSGDRQQDTYSDTTIPYVDAKVAAALCKGGPVAFVVKDEAGITDQWILDYVVPHIAQRVPRAASLVFGRALLWKLFDPETKHHVPAEIRTRVSNAYRGITTTLEEGDNPVRKVPLGVMGMDAELIIDEIIGGDGEGGGDYRHHQGMAREEIRLLASQVLHLRRENADQRAELDRRDRRIMSMLTRMNNNITRLANAPTRRVVAVDGGQAPTVPGEQPTVLVSSLCKNPGSLHDLWVEYEFGTAGKKAAKDFSTSERGQAKSKYSFRKTFWDKVAEMIRSGMSANVAIDRIYRAYGASSSISHIIRRMKDDKRTGWPPILETFAQ